MTDIARGALELARRKLPPRTTPPPVHTERRTTSLKTRLRTKPKDR